MQKLTGLWKSESRNGTTYYSGKVGNTRFILFKNDKRPDRNDPDLTLHVAKVDDAAPWTTVPHEDVSPSGQPYPDPAKAPERVDDLDDDVPF